MKDLIIFGIQGSGKWTQAAWLVKRYEWMFSYFSSWDVFRAITSTDNAIGNYLTARMEAGDLINDSVTNSLFETYFYTVLHDSKHMLLDWYPRTLPQMQAMTELFKHYERNIVWVNLVLDKDLAVQRMLERGRADDTPDVIERRIEQFYEKTQPIIDWFEDHFPLVSIDASKTVDEIGADFDALLL